MVTPGFINAARSVETKRIFDMVEEAKKLALSGSAMHAQMLMNLLKVPGGRETLWELTSAKERRDIQYLARTYKPTGTNPFAAG